MGISDVDNKRITKRVYQTLQQLGWFDTCVYALSKFLIYVSSGKIECYKYQLVAQPVPTTPLLSPERGKKIEVRLIHKQDQIVQEFPRPAAVIEARFEQGAVCLAAIKEEQFIGFIWLLLDKGYQEDEVRAHFIPCPAKQAAWDFDVYVAPDFRFGFAFPRLWDEANKILRNKGVKWSCSRISAFNRGSMESHARLGSLVMSNVFFLCTGRWQVTIFSKPPYLHLSTSPKSYPKFNITTEILENTVSIHQNNTNVE